MLQVATKEGAWRPARQMSNYILRRMLALVPTLVFASMIVFATVRLIPGDIVDLMVSQSDFGAVPMSRAQLVAALGLDRPIWAQYLDWAGAALVGDLGRSLWHGTAVREMVFERLPITFELGLLALLVAIALALPIGLYSAARQDSVADLVLRSLSIVLLAVPTFWLGTMVVVLPSIWWGWSPAVGHVAFRDAPLQNLRQMIVPALVLGAGLSAITMRLTRTMMLEALRQDYIRTAWAKGLRERRVVVGHALPNALIPVITLVGLQAPLLVGGAVIVEHIFVIPGMGALMLDAIGERDYPVVSGVFLVVGVGVMLLNLAVDIAYGLLDPRVRHS